MTWYMVCPGGHNSWTRRGDRYWCECCSEFFPHLKDMRHDDVERPPAPARRRERGGEA